jgi:hypothetical protein
VGTSKMSRQNFELQPSDQAEFLGEQ